MSYKVIYLTGAPAAGKSTLCRNLRENMNNVLFFEYGEEMSKHLKAKKSNDITQDILKSGIKGYVTKEDIDHIDNLMIEFADAHRKNFHVIVDSHHITKEKYGFAASVFSAGKLDRLNPTEIWVLYASSVDTRNRIMAKSEGRPLISPFQADMHTYLQANLALQYSFSLGIYTYLFESGQDPNELFTSVSQRLNDE